MWRTFFFLTLGWIPLLFAPPAIAQKRCGKVQDSPDWKYCISEPDHHQPHDLIHVFHDGGKKENRWQIAQWGEAIRNEWKQLGYPEPAVVSFSFGPYFILREKASDLQSGKLDLYFEKIFPFLETQLTQPFRRRLLMGVSMGGLNGAQVYLRKGDWFQKAVFACPAFSTLSPFQSLRQALQEGRRTGSDPGQTLRLWLFGRLFFPTPESWADTDPLQSENRLGPHLPATYVSCGTEDNYGFFEGARRFAEMTQTAGIPTTWAPVPGKHCSLDPVGIARFLAAP